MAVGEIRQEEDDLQLGEYRHSLVIRACESVMQVEKLNISYANAGSFSKAAQESKETKAVFGENRRFAVRGT